MNQVYLINLTPNNSSPVKTGYTFKNGDKGITLRALISEIDTSGTTAKIVFHRSNGTSVEADLFGTGPEYFYTTLGNEFAVPGIVVADIKLYNSTTQRISTASFVFNVDLDTMDGVGGGTGGYSDELETLTNELEELSDEFEQTLHEYQDAFGQLLPVRPRGNYNPSEPYEILDLVFYGGSSYVCRQDCTGIDPTNTTYWQTFAEGYTAPNYFSVVDGAVNLTYQEV